MITYPNVKINLGLNILRKRQDGFHDLETLFVPYFGMSDILEIEGCAGEASIDLEGGAWAPESDLSWRAYLMLRDEFGLPPVKMRLVKRNPVGAGLGGGSSDAAFTLRMLNEMFSLGLSDDAMASYAARLGSDCAFFVYNRPMFGEGRGEVLTPFDLDLSGYEIRVEIPEGVHVSTREAYSGVVPRDKRNDLGFASVGDTPGQTVSTLGHVRGGTAAKRWWDGVSVANGSLPGVSPADATLKEALRLPVEEWRGCVVNDFEPSVFALHPEIAALKERFYADGAVYAAMSGSGSAVFALFKK